MLDVFVPPAWQGSSAWGWRSPLRAVGYRVPRPEVKPGAAARVDVEPEGVPTFETR
jgi:hypothetical protein